MSTPKVKLSYFDIEGQGEPVRLALVLAGIPFEDDRFKFPEWSTVKPTTPYGQVPVMTVDGGPAMSQCIALMNYVATLDKTDTLRPADATKAYQVDEAIGIVEDMKRDFRPSLYISMRPHALGHAEDLASTDDGKALIAKMRTDFVKNDLPKYLGYLSDMIEKNGGTYLCGGDRPTLADCMAVPAIRNFTRGHVDCVPTDCVEKCNPKIVAYVERFCALPEIKGRYSGGLGAN